MILGTHFSPNGGCEKVIVDFINQATQSIRVMAYTFTNLAICNALVKKSDVKFIGDVNGMAGPGSLVGHLGSVEVWIDSAHKIMHDKVIIIDNHIVITGSYNFTNSAELHNAENLIVLDDVKVAGLYNQNWELHKSHSHPYAAMKVEIYGGEVETELTQS